MDLRELLFLKAMKGGGGGYVQATATGNPLTFNTNIAKPLKSLLIPWTPSQSGSGDPSPQNPREIQGVSSLTAWRTGKNLIDPTLRNVYSETTLYIGATDNSYTIDLLEGTYTLAVGYNSSAGYAVYIRGENDESSTNVKSASTLPSPFVDTATLTISNSQKYRVWLYRSSAQGGIDSNNVAWFTLVSGENAMIPTTIPVTFPAMGKNLLNDSNVVTGYVIAEDGTVTKNEFGKYIDYTPVSNEEYTISAFLTTGQQNYRLHGYDANKNWVEQINATFTESGYYSYTFTPGANIKYIRLSCSINSTQLQLERGSTRTSYEPYTNTVYGGSLDLTTGVLTVEWELKTVNDYTWTYQSANNRFTASEDSMKIYSNVRECPLYCSAFIPIFDKRPAEQVPNNAIYCGTSHNFFIYGTEYTDATAFKNAFKDVQILFPLATQHTIQLTPTQITALVGDNVIWSDTNGSNTAVYLKRG